MTTVILFVAAAGIGSSVRWAAARRWNGLGARLPWGTLLINVSGSLALGLLAGLGQPAATVVGTGALGALTTFSGFAGEVVAMLERRTFGRAVVYVVVTIAAGVSAAAIGLGAAARL